MSMSIVVLSWLAVGIEKESFSEAVFLIIICVSLFYNVFEELFNSSFCGVHSSILTCHCMLPTFVSYQCFI
jgi:hypothetical protein